MGREKRPSADRAKREDAWPEIVTNEWRWRRLAWRDDRQGRGRAGVQVLTRIVGQMGLGGSGREGTRG